MRTMTTTSKIVIKIITTTPKAATTPPKRPTFNWVPTKGYNHYIILCLVVQRHNLKLMCTVLCVQDSQSKMLFLCCSSSSVNSYYVYLSNVVKAILHDSRWISPPTSPPVCVWSLMLILQSLPVHPLPHTHWYPGASTTFWRNHMNHHIVKYLPDLFPLNSANNFCFHSMLGMCTDSMATYLEFLKELGDAKKLQWEQNIEIFRIHFKVKLKWSICMPKNWKWTFRLHSIQLCMLHVA